MLVIQDPSNEDEQARVMSQAQALLDCTADLVEHYGVLAAVDVLQVTLPWHPSVCTLNTGVAVLTGRQAICNLCLSPLWGC